MESDERRKRKELGNIVDVQVVGDKVILRVPDKNIVTEVDNVASFDSKTNKLISTGVTQEAFQDKYPKKWRKYKEHLQFRPIFDLEAFNPETAAMFLWGWWNNISRQAVPATTVFRWQAKLEMSISFDQYEKIPLQKQQEFEYLIFRYLYAKKLTINKDDKLQSNKSNPSILLFRTLNFIFGIGFILLGVVPVSALMAMLSDVDFPSLLSFLFFVSILFGGLFGLMYLGDFISKALWLLFMKPFFERQILIRTLEYQTNFPMKNKLGRAMSFLVDRLLGGNS